VAKRKKKKEDSPGRETIVVKERINSRNPPQSLRKPREIVSPKNPTRGESIRRVRGFGGEKTGSEGGGFGKKVARPGPVGERGGGDNDRRPVGGGSGIA